LTPTLDARLFQRVYAADGGALTGLMIALTIVGSGWTIFALVPLVAARRTRAHAGALGAVLVTTAIVVFVVKHLVRRVRPPFQLPGVHPLWDAPTDYSFPSGHAAGSFAVAAFVTVLCLRERRDEAWRWAVGALFVFAASAIALSRVYLGVHFPGDVTGGAALGALLGALGAEAFTRARRRKRASTPNASPTKAPAG
jgi:undecaprenyl-diphosphatase